MPDFQKADPQVVPRIVNEMESQGYSVIEGFLSEEQLQAARTHVNYEVERHHHEYFAMQGQDAVRGSIFEEMSVSPQVMDLFRDIYKTGTGQPPRSPDIFPALRCLQGKTGKRESYYFHYDAAALTALIPLVTPSEGRDCGDFIFFPNLRNIRSNLYVNILEKALMQNTLTQKLVTFAVKRSWLKPAKIKIVPGNAYFFWGYRSLHANEPCDPNALRSTVLLHYGEPHSRENLASKLLLGWNFRRARVINERTRRRDVG
ncbi:hypothetical protein M2262_003259 [Pseudomonas sp. BIGb0408]|uniref:Phytanoyl-CoA dioxygenase (PhyH) n=1 Tax=Phytopseudomonas flavescens TaxID=29435 RepID=A0A7Y9XIW6_9GAMM|nr:MULTISPECIES: hypothetical protein [Pseudomonas]MCW2293209.1 hypothetical protein [Pseudomonas sp. BIGb0408]NYH72220.1 hypothetical protein [Pseudomonas flavescens]